MIPSLSFISKIDSGAIGPQLCRMSVSVVVSFFIRVVGVHRVDFLGIYSFADTIDDQSYLRDQLLHFLILLNLFYKTQQSLSIHSFLNFSSKAQTPNFSLSARGFLGDLFACLV